MGKPHGQPWVRRATRKVDADEAMHGQRRTRGHRMRPRRCCHRLGQRDDRNLALDLEGGPSPLT